MKLKEMYKRFVGHKYYGKFLVFTKTFVFITFFMIAYIMFLLGNKGLAGIILLITVIFLILIKLDSLTRKVEEMHRRLM